MPAERLLGRVLGDLFSGQCPASFMNCVGERMCAKGVRVLEEDVRMVAVKSGVIRRGF